MYQHFKTTDFTIKDQCKLSVILEIIFFNMLLCFALFTIATHIVILLHLPFKVLIIIGTLLIIISFIYTAYKIYASKTAINDLPSLNNVARTFLCISLIVGISTALFVIRPDYDDAYYIPNALFYLDNPDMSMDKALKGIANTGVEYKMLFMTGSSNPIEYFWSLISFWTGSKYLHIYYILVPVLGAIFLVFVWFQLLSRFSTDVEAVSYGVLAICISLILLGEAHRSHGNYAFVRMWQGKVLFLNIVIPLFIKYSIEFFYKYNWKSWFIIFTLSIVGVGMTTSAIFMLPLLAGVLFLSIACGDFRFFRLDRVVIFFSSLIFLIGIAIINMSYAKQLTGTDYFLLARYPEAFREQFWMVFAGKYTFISFLTVFSFLATLFFTEGRQRKFIIFWWVAAVIFFLNPIISPIIMKYVTHKSAYWRLFYLAPFLLTVGILGANFYSSINKARLGKILCITIIIVGLIISFLPGFPSVFNHKNVRGYGIFKEKLDPPQKSYAEEILKMAPPGVMLTPFDLVDEMLVLSTRHLQITNHQITNHGGAILSWGEIHNDMEMAKLRFEAAEFVSNEGGDIYNFSKLLEKVKIPSIVMKNATYRSPDVKRLLIKSGYQVMLMKGDFILLVHKE